MMVTWSEEQLAEYQRRHAAQASLPAADVSMPPFKPPPNQAAMFALGRLKNREMNKTEAAYDAFMWTKRHAGALHWHEFEAIKFRLADNTFYTPDFAVLPADGFMEIHEVKGFWQDDARVKIKVAASLFPFKFVAIRKVKGGWEREEF